MKCPFCCEEIKDEATKCKHCKSDIIPQTTQPIGIVEFTTTGCIKSWFKIFFPNGTLLKKFTFDGRYVSILLNNGASFRSELAKCDVTYTEDQYAKKIIVDSGVEKIAFRTFALYEELLPSKDWKEVENILNPKRSQSHLIYNYVIPIFGFVFFVILIFIGCLLSK